MFELVKTLNLHIRETTFLVQKTQMRRKYSKFIMKMVKLLGYHISYRIAN